MNNLKITFIFFFLSVSLWMQAQPYQVGRKDFSFIDASRNNRNVFGEIHYPAATVGTDVPILVGQYPIIVFGHGFATNIDQYDGVYSEGLVREGYIIVYPETEGGLFGVDHGDFGDDISFLVDTYLAENMNPASFFYQSINGKTAVMGHSMGGGASFLAAGQNPNIDAHASLAAAETNPSAIAAAANVTVPALVIAGGEDCVVPAATNQVLMYNAIPAFYKSYVEINGANHCNFGEAAAFSNCVTGEVFSSCGNPTIPKADQHIRTLDVLKPFFDYWLKADCVAWDTYQTYLTTSANHTYMQERTEPTVTSISSSSATIAFTTLPGVTTYTVTVTEQGGSNSMTGSSSINTVVVTGLSPNTTYNFVVTTDCGTGNSPYSIGCSDPSTTCNMTENFITDMGCPAILNLGNSILSGTYIADMQVISNGSILSPEVVVFKSAQMIDLLPDFEVFSGAEFTAEIDTQVCP